MGTSQLDLSGPLAASVVELGVTVPAAGYTLSLHVALPIFAVPLAVSVTVAVHAAGAATGTELGVQLIAVVVERVITLTVVLPLLAVWMVSGGREGKRLKLR